MGEMILKEVHDGVSSSHIKGPLLLAIPERGCGILG